MFVGVDFGATSIRAGRVSRGKVVARARCVTRPERGVDGLADDVAQLVRRVSLGRLDGVGLGFCGMVEARRGVVMTSTDTLPGWRKVPLARRLEARLGVPCAVDNDANCAALGEWKYGAGRRANPFVLLTLGTGLGGGVIVGGEVLHGAGHMAGKLGHLKVRRGGRACACGGRGCAEAYASAFGMRRAYGADPKTVFGDARAGSEDAQRVVDDAADAIGHVLATVAHALNPARVAIGGGMGRAWSLLLPRALRVFEENTMITARESCEVVRASLGDDAGILGATLLVKRR